MTRYIENAMFQMQDMAAKAEALHSDMRRQRRRAALVELTALLLIWIAIEAWLG